ncbi:DUF1176 domain-containing protein [Caulobacter sp.]|uniref:DUF1176 domain-containing protein n=1 Tax=Caulobacter sp. TaxID=78 RepID=UPI001B2AA402|nr:DUF1176 domain-containing protein [Caulobacter sp.]MBO9545357.1 DUF1176 domain-containing protein [Caulobacter sp.]
MLRAAVLLAGLLLAAPAVAQDVAIKDWWVACDNVRVCTAYGFPPEDAYGVVLRVRREAEADAAATLDLGIDAETAKGVSGPLTLTVDGKVVARTAAPEGTDDEYRTWSVSPARSPALLEAIARGEVLEARDGGRTVATVSLSGGSASLRWMDDRQRRVGGVTALVAKGAAPASAVPSPPVPPLIRPAKPVSQDGLTDTPPPAVLARIKSLDCQADAPEDPTSNRLAPDVVLWVIPCWVGAYQISSALVLADEKGGHARLADLGGAGDTRAMATNAVFNTDDQKLYSYAKGRGLADCGESRTHAWTGKGFVLTERSELQICRGLPEDYWVTMYRSR